MAQAFPNLGVGIGYRAPLREDILAYRTEIDFLEIISDQFMYVPDERMTALFELKKHFPIIPHSIGLSVGSASPLNCDYVARLSHLVDLMDPPWFSDHLSFTQIAHTNVEQLTPLWFTEESLEAVCRNIKEIKQQIPKPLALENITYYFSIPEADMTEAEFISRTLIEADCGLLLDINNVWINSQNLQYDPYEFINSLPLDRIIQIHIAGNTRRGNVILDTHNSPVTADVWDLLYYVLNRSAARSVLLEWDTDFPIFEDLIEQLKEARRIISRCKLA